MKRLIPMLLALAIAFLPLAADARGKGRSHGAKATKSSVAKSHARAPAKSAKGTVSRKGATGGSGGCGSRGGPGYRKANGKCAGWKG